VRGVSGGSSKGDPAGAYSEGSQGARGDFYPVDVQPAPRIFLIGLIWRVSIAILQLTAFAPDEYFQGPEVAHRVVYGYGHITWEWVAGLRSYLHPMLYVLMYRALGTGGNVGHDSLWSRVLVWWGPYVMHAVIAAWTDVGVHLLAKTVCKDYDILRQTNALFRWNWFAGYCMVRPYSSSLEAALCTYGLYAYISSSQMTNDSCIKHRKQMMFGWLSCGAICVVLRPASGLFWAAVALHALALPGKGLGRMLIIFAGTVVGAVFLFASVCLDTMMYGRLELVPWNFLRFNVLEGGSALYGVSPWHANFSMHLPSILLNYFPIFMYGCYSCFVSAGGDGQEGVLKQKKVRQANPICFLAWCALLWCLIYSIPAHKEVRFLLPAVPMCMPVVASGVKSLAKSKGRLARWLGVLPRLGWLHSLALVYFSLFHQRGQVSVMSAIRRMYDGGRLAGTDGSMSVLFLTPCHATPYYASVHSPSIRMRFFDCSPAQYRDRVYSQNKDERSWLTLEHIPLGMSEREYFEANPRRALEDALTSSRPDVIVSFENTAGALMDAAKQNYTLRSTHFNCPFGPESRIAIFSRQFNEKNTGE
jgi:phosphatidylinositol glycan class B